MTSARRIEQLYLLGFREAVGSERTDPHTEIGAYAKGWEAGKAALYIGQHQAQNYAKRVVGKPDSVVR